MCRGLQRRVTMTDDPPFLCEMRKPAAHDPQNDYIFISWPMRLRFRHSAFILETKLLQDPPQASNLQPNKMCHGVQHIHIECQHAKKFVVTEHCPLSPGTDCPHPVILHTVTVTAPRLCVPCFRQKEAEMDAQFEQIKAGIQTEIARVDEHFANGFLQTDASGVRIRYRADREDDILKVKRARDLSIRIFRQEQGVWGDG